LTESKLAVRCAARWKGRPRGRTEQRGAKKDGRHGVDGIEIGCKIVGSLGHFGDSRGLTGKALRPAPRIFDSVRR